MPSIPPWLATLVRLRQKACEECRRQLDEALRAAAALDERQAAITSDAGQLADVRRQASRPGGCDVNLLLSAQRHQAVLQIEQQAIAQQAQLLEQEVERRRLTLAEAQKQVRVLEKLAERKQLAATRESHLREEKRLDELATLMHHHSQARRP